MFEILSRDCVVSKLSRVLSKCDLLLICLKAMYLLLEIHCLLLQIQLVVMGRSLSRQYFVEVIWRVVSVRVLHIFLYQAALVW